MKLDDRDIIGEQDYTTLSNAELVAHIERYAGLMHTTPLSDGEWLDDILGPARVLLARAEAAEARIAELEAALAAQQWRPGSETPVPDWYQTAETIDGVFSHAYYDGASWHGYPDNYPPLWYRPIPPLPPAPDAQEPTP